MASMFSERKYVMCLSEKLDSGLFSELMGIRLWNLSGLSWRS